MHERAVQAAVQAAIEKAKKDELLTPKQVHADYGFSPQLLANWRWCSTGPDFIKLSPGRGGRIKYRRSSIESWLEAQTVKVGGQRAA
ncbi:helix-turn-helix domain-containing protein [Streptomyces adustus]|uniref:Helix-turn-helix domain-containing protein n=2 Tax=Streptomyces adustus TaxID=1609272 RepID=A0A5N8VHD5_9ACTN|nr:DNA-binding protein [Streptomyces adustus]MPY34092.1 helix-turn-helix domain-containing protein [Streptomyces adustus]